MKRKYGYGQRVTDENSFGLRLKISSEYLLLTCKFSNAFSFKVKMHIDVNVYKHK